jgi:hypothetical protein
MLPQLENLAKVARALRQVPERFVFAGASVLPLFLDETFRGNLRQTDDTDVVVPVIHYADWSRLRDALIQHGFRERADDRASRQILFWFGDLAVDFIPARMVEFGTENRWLSIGYDLAEPHELENGEVILRLSVSCWLAAKIAAFERRGRQDVLMSRDLDDIVTLLIGSAGIVEDVRDSPLEIRSFVEGTFQEWSSQPLVWDAMDSCVTGVLDRQRLNEIRSRLTE